MFAIFFIDDSGESSMLSHRARTLYFAENFSEVCKWDCKETALRVAKSICDDYFCTDFGVIEI